MKQRALVRRRAGMGIPELIVGLVIMGILGIAAVKTFISQTRFAELQQKKRFARTVARAPVNLLLSEIRMADNANAVAAASSASGASSVTVRIPVSMAIVCGSSGAGTVLSLTPTDSAMSAGAAPSGYAYRTTSGLYSYTETPLTITSSGAGVCAAANITTLPGGRVVTVVPVFPVAATPGTPAFIYQRVRFSFAPSAIFPGRLGMWRTLEATGATEELAAPFDSSSRFRFYRNSNDTADVAVPPLNEINGIEFVLSGSSDRPRFGKAKPETALFRTSVFFTNRVN
ncbi:MAG TPA: type II secretion system protein [Gemmatimonadaceae bacterium]|nr:type II secretion system protein [Gemmatimonadaceae bacterium]